jgi:hypothetical protein
MSKDTTKDWMEKLVENYRIPTEEEQKKLAEKPKKVLSESQLKKILNRDN